MEKVEYETQYQYGIDGTCHGIPTECHPVCHYCTILC